MTKRLKEIFSVIPVCGVFADIGCDHGYITKAMLDEKKCKKAIASDISEKCLEKAKKLLNEYIDMGSCTAVVSNGFENILEFDTALIAGMGGEEIISILEKAKTLPENLILQPMKNVDKVRRYVTENGYKIQRDYVFESENKLYDLIVLKKGKDSLLEEEILFGRDNLKKPTESFYKRLNDRLNLIEKLLDSGKLSQSEQLPLLKEREMLKKYV